MKPLKAVKSKPKQKRKKHTRPIPFKLSVTTSEKPFQDLTDNSNNQMKPSNHEIELEPGPPPEEDRCLCCGKFECTCPQDFESMEQIRLHQKNGKYQWRDKDRAYSPEFESILDAMAYPNTTGLKPIESTTTGKTPFRKYEHRL